MPKNWNTTISIQEAKAAYAVGDDLDAYCFLYEGDRARPVRITASGNIVTLPPYVPPATLYTTTGRFVDSLIAEISPVQSGSGDPSPDNIRPISGWPSCNITVSPTLDAEDGMTYTITFPSEAGIVYGGTIDVTTGVLTVDRAVALLDNASLWSLSSSGTTPYIYNRYFYDRKIFNNSYTGLLCSVMPVNSLSLNYTARWVGATSPLFGIKAENPTISLDIFKDLSSRGELSISYLLAAPQTYRLTPTEVTLLLSENNIFANTGPINLTYVETQEV